MHALKMAPAADMFTATIAFVALTVEFQPEIVPSSVQKMKEAGLVLLPEVTLNKVVAFEITPLTGPPVGAVAVGTWTTRVDGVPLVEYMVDVPVPLLPIQNGLVAERGDSPGIYEVLVLKIGRIGKIRHQVMRQIRAGRSRGSRKGGGTAAQKHSRQNSSRSTRAFESCCTDNPLPHSESVTRMKSGLWERCKRIVKMRVK